MVQRLHDASGASGEFQHIREPELGDGFDEMTLEGIGQGRWFRVETVCVLGQLVELKQERARLQVIKHQEIIDRGDVGHEIVTRAVGDGSVLHF